MESTPAQRYIAEFIGTFFLLVAVTGAVLVTLVAGPPGDYSFALLIALSIGLGIAGLIYALGDISGGHFNPAVTAAFALSRRMPLRDVGPYLAAQVAGGFLGVLAVASVAHGYNNGWSALVNTGFGSQGYAPGSPLYHYPLGSVAVFEVLVTFFFVFVILRSTRAESGVRNLAPLAIGLTLTVANLIGIGIDGASFNPARSFGPALVSQMFPPAGGAWSLGQSWLFWVAPIIGGLLAGAVEVYVLAPKRVPASPGPSADPST